MFERYAPLVALLLIPFCGWAQPTYDSAEHLLHGVVVTQQGLPASFVEVAAWPITSSSQAGGIRWVSTNEKGEFTLSLPHGNYMIRARSVTEGYYPDPSFLLNRDDSAHFPRVKVTDSELRGVRVVLGQRGGVLKGVLGTAGTSSVGPFKMRVTDAANPAAFIVFSTAKDGSFRIVLPPKEVLLGLELPSGAVKPLNGGNPIVVKPGEETLVHLSLID